MRFIANAAQFALIASAFVVAGKILPLSVVKLYTWIAQLFLLANTSWWILEIIQDYFFTAKVDPKNKAVLITGCDTGFGNAVARILDKRGYQVFACCYDKTSDGAFELQHTCSNRLKIIQLDVTNDESVEKAVKAVELDLGNSDLWAVVNNAGVLRGFHTELSTMKDYEMCMQVNALGIVRVTKAFLPMLRKSRGRVVNICSMAGRTRCHFMGAYIMSKSAAVAFCEVLVQEMREFGVRVISIEPEFFGTQMCSKEYLHDVFKESCSEMDSEKKSAYGTKYVEKAQDVYRTVFTNCSPEVKLVHDAIESAVSLQTPADVYKVTRNILSQAIFMGIERAPKFLNEMLMISLLFIMGLPTPKKGVNIIYRLLNM